MAWEKTLQSWGKHIPEGTLIISTTVTRAEEKRLRDFAKSKGMTLAALLRAGARKLLEENGVSQPQPQYMYVPEAKK